MKQNAKRRARHAVSTSTAAAKIGFIAERA